MATPALIHEPLPPAYQANGGFETANGTLYVSKPYRSKNSKKLRTLITFAPRASTFDMNNEDSNKNEFRGFFSLFWISIFIFTVRTYVRSIETSGRPLNMRFANSFSEDAIMLAISDGVLVGSTGISVLFAKAMKRGWIQYYWAGIILQHLFQTAVLFSAISWTFNRNWPWVQSGFLTLHSLVMIMKTHSYITVNGELQQVEKEAKSAYARLEKATESMGWDNAMEVARGKQAIHESKPSSISRTSSRNSNNEPTPIGTPPVPEGMSTSYVDVSTANDLRKRLTAIQASATRSESFNGDNLVGPGSLPHKTSPDIDVHGVKSVHKLHQDSTQPQTFVVPEEDQEVHESLKPHPLVYHPDDNISTIAKEYSDLQSELVSSGPEYVKWPDTITWKNFAVYQLIPTLVYELEYPRTDRIRPLYVFEKTVATFGTFALLYTITETFILPYTPTPDQSFFRSLLDLALPFMIAYLMVFYIIFECICNGFAELSYFADRQFYEDWYVPNLLDISWWNSTSWDEFARKWNKPVHTFLLRHIYSATRKGYGISKSSAMLITFFVSALAHELVMAVVTKKLRMYLFTLQLIQIPLIMVGRLPIIKRNKVMGNIVFWVGIYAGLPLLCVAYCAY